MPDAGKIQQGCKTQADSNWIHAQSKVGSIRVNKIDGTAQIPQELCQHKHQRCRNGSLENGVDDIPGDSPTEV